MRHRANDSVLIELSNEVPGGAELADEARRADVLRVTDTQYKFMDKLGLLDHHGTIITLRTSSIRIEKTS